MYSINDLDKEIQQIIQSYDDRNVSIIHPDWVTQEVMSRHMEVSGNDAEFYLCVSRQTVRDSVRKRINRYKASEDGGVDPQMVLPGYERLQTRYLIKQGKERIAIRVQDMTHAQLLDKAREYRVMGDGSYQHADEIERYAEERRSAAA